jgi:hypothetical protein
MKKKICDNTNCIHGEKGVDKLYKVLLRKEFIDEDDGICYWCDSCIKIDGDMIEEILDE